jgi:hypothetical protein
MSKTSTYEAQEERTSLLNEASRIRAIASAERRNLKPDEDLRILEFMNRAQALDEEIARLKRLP